MILSVQMYSLRNDVGRDGLETVFKKIKAAGFGGVEFAGTYNMRLDDLKKMLDDNGLVATGAHVGWDLLNKSVAECVDTAAALGYKDIICPGIWKDEIWQPDIYDRVNAIAAEIPAGYRFGYHNHSHEFEKGDFLKGLYDNVPSILFEPDTFWLKAAGKNPVAYCGTLAPRVMALHLKELSAKGVEDFNPIPGEGVTGCADVVRLGRRLGHDYIVLEAENLAIPYDEYLALTARFVASVD